MNTTTHDEIPGRIRTIIAQLGGAQIFAMAFTGSTYDVRNCPTLTLKIAPALVRMVPTKATHVVVRLETSDTYTVLLVREGKLRGGKYTPPKTVATRDDVYGDCLRRVVEDATGLRMGLR